MKFMLHDTEVDINDVQKDFEDIDTLKRAILQTGILDFDTTEQCKLLEHMQNVLNKVEIVK